MAGSKRRGSEEKLVLSSHVATELVLLHVSLTAAKHPIFSPVATHHNSTRLAQSW